MTNKMEVRSDEIPDSDIFDSMHWVAEITALIGSGEINAARNLLNEVPRGMVTSDDRLQRLATVLAPPRVARSPQVALDRTRDYEWLKENGAAYVGQWVALLGGGLVASLAR
jgi:hypothetical protein